MAGFKPKITGKKTENALEGSPIEDTFIKKSF